MESSNGEQHPLEALYRVRDELQRATAVQSKTDLTKQDLPSYGWALQAIVNSLAELTGALATQVDEIDRERLHQEALQDHPYEVIDHSLQYLQYLRRSLNAAIEDAKGYRESAEDVHGETRDESRGGGTE